MLSGYSGWRGEIAHTHRNGTHLYSYYSHDFGLCPQSQYPTGVTSFHAMIWRAVADIGTAFRHVFAQKSVPCTGPASSRCYSEACFVDPVYDECGIFPFLCALGTEPLLHVCVCRCASVCARVRAGEWVRE
jgi:hypothetical protein